MLVIPQMGIENWDLPEGGREYHAHTVIAGMVYGYTHRVSEMEVEAFGGDPKFFPAIERTVLHQFLTYLLDKGVLERVDTGG